MAKKLIGRAVNAITNPLGYSVVTTERVDNAVNRDHYVRSICEVEVLARAMIFPGIPENPSRHPLLGELIGTQIVEALFLLNELHQALKVEGDICEFGIAQGSTSALMANEIRNTDRKLWLFDSFEGLPKPTEKDVLIDDIFKLGSMEKYQGTMSVGKDSVLTRMKDIAFPLDRILIVPGFIEETSKSAALPKKVAFAYVDFDFYEPILIGLRLLKDRLPVGGRVMVDDYGWFSDGAQKAVDEFVEECKGQFSFRLPPKGSGHFAMLEKLREQ